MSNDEFSRRLLGELSQWESDGIITAEQAQAIRDRHGSTETGRGLAAAVANRMVSIVAIMGAALIGLGIIAFIAANWSEMPRFARLALMIVGTPTLYVAGWLVGYRFDYPRIGVAILLLGAIAFGASIHLIAQIYHVPVNHPNLIPLWFLGVVPLGYLVRSQPLMALSIILLLVAAGFRLQVWAPGLDIDAVTLAPPVFLMLGAFLFAAGRLQARCAATARFARLFDIAGLLTAAAAIYVAGFRSLWDEIQYASLDDVTIVLEYWLVLAGVALATALLLAVAGRHSASRPTQIWWEAGGVAALVLAMALIWIGMLSRAAWMWAPFNLVMLAGVLAMIVAGYRWNRAYLINLAIAVFAVTLFTRYFEFGFGLLGQAVAFIVAGVILLAGGFGLDYLRRRLLRQMQSAGGNL